MIRSYRQITGAHILGGENGELLAILRDVIIDPDTGKIEGFWVKPLTLPVKNAVILSDSVLEWKKNVYIKDDREIAEAEDIIRISELLSRNTFFIGNSVVSESGQMLGRVNDLDFDTSKMYLRNIYSEKSLLGFFKHDQRTFSYDSIIQVLPEYILVKDTADKKVGVKDVAQPLLDV